MNFLSATSRKSKAKSKVVRVAVKCELTEICWLAEPYDSLNKAYEGGNLKRHIYKKNIYFVSYELHQNILNKRT